MRGKRTKFETGDGVDDYVLKCMSCVHSYTHQNESDILYCGCRTGCHFENIKDKDLIKQEENHETYN